MDKKYNLAVIGAGPGGYVAAIRGAQLNLSVLLIEKEKLGGACMNWGCIPTKYLLHQTKILKEIKTNLNFEGPLNKIRLNWHDVQKEKEDVVQRLVSGIDFLLEKNGIDVVKGTGRLDGQGRIVVEQDGERQKAYEAKKVILASGSRPAGLPSLRIGTEGILTSREALDLEAIPKEIFIIGAGAIGLEIGTIFQRMGTEVTILEVMPTILPGCDKSLAARLERMLKKSGLDIRTRMKIEESRRSEGRIILRGISLKDSKPFEFSMEKVLLAVGRSPNSENLVAEEPPGWKDDRGYIRVDSHLQTSLPGVYAIGDLIGGQLLAHKASHEGIIAAENASGMQNSMNYSAVPAAVFTDPEMADVGLTEEEARDQGMEPLLGVFPIQASSRALTMGQFLGMIKVVADPEGRIIGAHILAPNASEMIAELTTAVSAGLTLEDIGSSIHIHPTLSEAVMEAALKAKDQAIHILNH